MTHNIMDILVTEKAVNHLREKSRSLGLPLSEMFKISLNEWFVANEADLEQIKDFSPLCKLTIKADEETELLYSLFVTQNFIKLIDGK